METTRLSFGGWMAKHATCPHCGASIGSQEVIETLPAPDDGAYHIVDCTVCRKHSRFAVMS